MLGSVYFAVMAFEHDGWAGSNQNTVESITAAIAELPPAEVAQVREWLAGWSEHAEAEWDNQIEADERSGRLDTLADQALAK